MPKIKYHVRVSDQFLEETTMAAIEAYHFGDGRKGDRVKLETYGHIWGYTKRDGDTRVYYLDRMSLNLSARRTPSSVLPNASAASAKLELMQRWSPQMSLLGDFHSHPYDDLEEVRIKNGFEFSDVDFSSFLADDIIWENSGNSPVMIVTTICRLQKVHETAARWQRNNVWQFDIGQFRCWMNCVIGYTDGKENSDKSVNIDARRATKNAHSDVFLDLNSRFLYNNSGGRLIV